jgi:hypothetical protein
MAAHPAPKATATPGRVAPWLAELARTLPGLVNAYRPRGPLDPRSRERVIMAVTEVAGCRYTAWIHGAWLEFVGGAGAADADESLLEFARTAAEAGHPVDAGPLGETLPPDTVDAVRATVAQIEIANLIGNTADSLRERLAGRRSFRPVTATAELVTVAAAAPVALGLFGLAAAMRAVNRVAPPPAEVAVPDDEELNLLAHVLSEAAPRYLANGVARLLVLGLPRSFAIGLRAGRTPATVRVGRGEVAVENGIATDCAVIVEGEVEPLIEFVTGHLVREIGTIRVKPR